MPSALRAGLSFCLLEDRLLFLDVPADRYFCLSRAAEQAVLRLYQGEPPDAADRAKLADLARTGLIVPSDRPGGIAPCIAPPVATRSLLEASPIRPNVTDRTAALLHLTLAATELRIAGFARAIARAARHKCRAQERARSDRVAAVAAAFAACNALVSAQDRCLPRSIAVAHRLMRLGARPDLVIAVKLGPFKAHAWVQWGDALVNERIETARMFTPILVL